MKVGELTIECVRGDITDQPDCDAVVNAANAQLAPGGGVAGAIHAKAGPGLAEECAALAPIRTGDSVMTSGHGLPNPWCIHTLGPVHASSADPPGELASCYRSSLRCAEERGLRSVAFPAVSTGAFGYPVALAAEVALSAVLEVAGALRSVRLVRFVLFGPDDARVHRDTLQRLAAERA